MNGVPRNIVVVYQLPQKIEADLALLFLFKEDRPPKGYAGLIDWYLNGHISYLIKYSHFKAELGEIGLLVSGNHIAQQGVLLMGMGKRQKLDGTLIEKSIEKAVEVLHGLEGERIILNPFISDNSGFAHSSITLLNAVLQFLTSPTRLNHIREKDNIEFMITIDSMEELQALRNHARKLKGDKILSKVNLKLP